MARKRKRQLRATGVKLEIPVLEYLDQLCDAEDRDRSYLLNVIVRKYAQNQGVNLPSAETIEDQPHP